MSYLHKITTIFALTTLTHFDFLLEVSRVEHLDKELTLFEGPFYRCLYKLCTFYYAHITGKKD